MLSTARIFIAISVAIPALALGDAEVDRNLKDALDTGREMKAKESKESMRDKDHDNRARINDRASIGVDNSGINVRINTDKATENPKDVTDE